MYGEMPDLFTAFAIDDLIGDIGPAYPPIEFWSIRALHSNEKMDRANRAKHAPLLTKRFKFSPTKNKYQKSISEEAKHFAYRFHTARTWDELVRNLAKIVSDPHAGIIRGEWTGTDANDARRLKVEKHGAMGTVREKSRAWVMIDSDGMPVPEGFNYLADPAAGAAMVAAMLPAEFQGATYWWGASSSYGTQPWFGESPELKFHLFYMLTESVPDADLKRWAKWVNERASFKLIDPLLMNSVQEHYLAGPVFENCADPLPHGRFGLCRGDRERVALVLPPADWVKARKVKEPKASAPPAGTTANDDVEGGGSTARGFLGHLERIGPDGFHIPIFSACLSYFSNEGPAAPAGPLKAALRQRILTADPGGRSKGEIDRYASDDNLDSDIASARAKIAEERKPKASKSLPPYHPRPTEDRDAALARQRQVIREWFADAAKLAEAARRESVARKGWEVADEFEDVDAMEAARDLWAAPLLTKADKAKRTRAMRAKIAVDLGFDGGIPAGRRVLVTGSQGSGKSRAAAEEIAALTVPTVVWWAVPTIGKADEQAEEYRLIASPLSLPVMVVRGRSQVDPLTGKLMCRRDKAARLVTAAGRSVGEILCPTCRFRDDCGYLRQKRAIKEMGGRGLFLLSAEYLVKPCPAPPPQMLVADESMIPAAWEEMIVYRRSVARAAEQFPSLGPVFDAFVGDDGAALPMALARLRGCCTVAEIKAAARDLRAAAKVDAESLVLTGDMADEAIAEAVGAMLSREHGKIAGLLDAIAVEMELPRATFNAVKYEQGKRIFRPGCDPERADVFTVWRMARLNIARKKPVLLLDGTGSPWLNRKVWGEDLEHHHIPVERTAKVIGTVGKGYSGQSVTGRNRRGEEIEAKAEESERLRKEIAGIAASVSAERGPVFVCASKKVEEALADVLPDDVARSHFSAVRGINEWKGCAAALVVGREQPGPADVENQVRAFLADEAEPLLTVLNYVPQSRGRRMADGSVAAVEVEVHPDPRVQEMLEQVREAEIVQAADRVRPIFNDRWIGLLNNLVCDIRYDANASHAELARGGSRIKRAWALKGVLMTSPSDLSAVYPDLWASEEAAKKFIQRLEKGGQTPNNISIWKLSPFFEVGEINADACRFRYRRRGARGRAPEAIVDARFADARATVEALLGPLSLWEPVQV